MTPHKSQKYVTPEDRAEEAALSGLIHGSEETAPLVEDGTERRNILKEAVLEDKDAVLQHDILSGSIDAKDILSQSPYEAVKGEKDPADISRRRREKWGRGQAERDDIRLDVEAAPEKRIMYGTVEQPEVSEQTPFHTEDRKVFAESVNPPEAEQIKESFAQQETATVLPKTTAYINTLREQTTERSAAGSGPLARAVSRAVDDAVIPAADDDLDERVGTTAQKYGYHAGKYAVKGVGAVMRGGVHAVGILKRVHTDLNAETLTKGGAAKTVLKESSKGFASAAGGVAGIIKNETVYTAENFRGSEDWGIETAVQIKDTYRQTKGVIKTGYTAIRSVKWAAEKAGAAVQRVVSAAKTFFTSAVTVKGSLIAVGAAAAIGAVFFLITAGSSVFLTMSLKSENKDLSQTYLYITELDARMEHDILTEDQKPHSPSIDEYGYYLNGRAVSKAEMEVYTNADLILAYLDSKYDDYSFSGVIAGLFGTTVKGEIEEIHGKLHQVEKRRWREVIHEDDSIIYIYHMDIYLTTQTWEDYYEANKDELLTEEQQEKYDTLREVGVYTFRKELGSPFPGVDWSPYVSSRWGWRIHPITGELKQHLGLDIAMPGGTPVSACNSGTVQLGYDANGWGNYVKIVAEDGTYTLYGHLRSTAATSGQKVNTGDVIGYVGTTGASTGDHLHLEYHQDGESLNPLIFTECDTAQEGDST